MAWEKVGMIRTNGEPKRLRLKQPIPAKATLPPRSPEARERKRLVDQGFFPTGEPLPTLLDQQARVTRLREAILLPAAAMERAEPRTATEVRMKEWELLAKGLRTVPAQELPEMPGIPVASSPQELAELAATFGTAVMVLTAPAETLPLEGEILPPQTSEEKMQKILQEKAQQMNHFQDAMMYAAMMGIVRKTT